MNPLLVIIYVIGSLIFSYGCSYGNSYVFALVFGFLILVPVLFVTMLRYLNGK